MESNLKTKPPLLNVFTAGVLHILAFMVNAVAFMCLLALVAPTLGLMMLLVAIAESIHETAEDLETPRRKA